MNHLHCHIYSREEDFIRDIRAGGTKAEHAISCLYLKHRQKALAYFQKLIASNPDYKGVPEDLAHDAFIVMIEKIRFEYFPVRTLAGFWMGIGKHLLANKLRRDSRMVLVEDPENVYATLEDPASPPVLKDHEESEWMAQAFQKLEAHCRSILLHWLDGYSMHEIAVLMGLSSAAMARKHKYHCFKKLKEIIRDGNISGYK